MKPRRVVIIDTVTTVYLVPADEAQTAEAAEEVALSHNEQGCSRLIETQRAEQDVLVDGVPA